MAEKIILTADPYDNAVTERKGDYTVKPRITGTARNKQIAERIQARDSEKPVAGSQQSVGTDTLTHWGRLACLTYVG